MTPRTLPPLPQYRDDAVTRQLSAHTHLDENFAQEVLDEFTADRLKAIGLPLGINLVALVRHAHAAQRRRRLRDIQLSLVLLMMVAALLAAVVSLSEGAQNSAVVFAGGAVLAVLIGAAVVQHALRSAWRAAREVYRGQDRPQDLAPAVEKEVEDRLRALRRANVVPYDARAEADNPFVGSGDQIKEDVWPSIDVGRPDDAPTGGKLTIIPFDTVDLHAYMAREMGGIAGLSGLRTRNRLYVRGLHVHSLGPDLLPDPLKRPLPRIDERLVQSGVLQEGGGMRTYLSLEVVGKGGKFVVSMHLRARRTVNRLSWQVAAYVLPPVQERFDHVAYIPLGGFEEWWELFKATGRGLRWMLFGAPGRIRRRGAAQTRRTKQLRRIRRDISKHRVGYDYGATDSLRERAACQVDDMDFDERMDALDVLQRLQQGVLVATEKFLKDHNIDTSDFDRAQRVINNQTYNIGSVSGGQNQFGNQGINSNVPQAGGQGNQQAQPPAQPAGGARTT
ncbi:hypothetical protein [Streptomyces albipurpureus]|uniref:Aromatic ring-opening dioxygenase LigA n=1 Tax=Streptomyces albipurpureus TaxID=2897419 RepID=A0ABT0UHV1_9ACTN|nr:hypothetical protein [Streptomyces sp. CWNU-1]MCM2386891.1 hypothetical protein [Streptomyces sp. CWNU-1]